MTCCVCGRMQTAGGKYEGRVSLRQVSVQTLPAYPEGYALAAAMHDMRTAQIVGNTVFWLCMFLGDVWFPLRALPSHMQQLGRLLPLAPFLQALRGIGLSGQPLRAHLGALAVLGLWSLVAAAVALGQFRWHKG